MKIVELNDDELEATINAVREQIAEADLEHDAVKAHSLRCALDRLVAEHETRT